MPRQCDFICSSKPFKYSFQVFMAESLHIKCMENLIDKIVNGDCFRCGSNARCICDEMESRSAWVMEIKQKQKNQKNNPSVQSPFTFSF